MTCASAIEPPSATIPSSAPVSEAIARWLANGRQPLCVLGEGGRLAGIFGPHEVAGLMLPSVARLDEDGCDLGFVCEEPAILRERVAVAEGTVGAFMTPSKGIPLDTSLVKALSLLYQGQAFLPVVDRGGQVMGVITIDRALAKLLEPQ